MATKKKKSKNNSEAKSGSSEVRSSDDTVAVRKKKRSLESFAVRFLVAFGLIITLVPLGLLLLYRVDGVKPVSTLMVREALVGAGAKRQWVELEDMSPRIYQSILMSEDGQFCSHNGVDWSALNQVIDDALEGERTRGASTITMQLVKNLFLWPERSFIRKGLEIPYAMMAELVLDKRRIMEIYLNIVELDEGVFGVGAAAPHYFKTSAEKLGPRNSARLAVTLPNPKGRNPAKPTRKLRSLAAVIQKRARASGAYIGCLKDPA
ncbi:MAG: monofunctional biosynthetic peptidoglycan transglycosylase [Rhizobiaceae bacterium]|nr:monofunctional biosynthetic peptidoglycan transglycosylase [Rhizobiaceae bacterium]